MRLQQVCKSKSTTVTAVLKKIGIGTANGTYWKNGSVPSSETVVKLAEFLNVSTDFLLTGKEKNSSANLKDDEQELLTNYRKLNNLQKGIIIGRTEALVSIKK